MLGRNGVDTQNFSSRRRCVFSMRRVGTIDTNSTRGPPRGSFLDETCHSQARNPFTFFAIDFSSLSLSLLLSSTADRSTMVYRGPVKNRSCTDILCLIIFVAFLFGWGVIGYYGKISHGIRNRVIWMIMTIRLISF